MAYSTSELRNLWGPPCAGAKTTMELYGSGRVTVDSRVTQAVAALDRCLQHARYQTRRVDTGAYNCRQITGGTNYSLHAYGIALDINWQSNPYGQRLVTDMPPAMVAEIKALRTNSGHQIWRWGGDYSGNKDAMHYEVVCSPVQLATGIAGPRPVPPPTSDGDFTMDAEAKKAFADLNKRLDAMEKRVDASRPAILTRSESGGIWVVGPSHRFPLKNRGSVTAQQIADWLWVCGIIPSKDAVGTDNDILESIPKSGS